MRFPTNLAITCLALIALLVAPIAMPALDAPAAEAAAAKKYVAVWVNTRNGRSHSGTSTSRDAAYKKARSQSTFWAKSKDRGACNHLVTTNTKGYFAVARWGRSGNYGFRSIRGAKSHGDAAKRLLAACPRGATIVFTRRLF